MMCTCVYCFQAFTRASTGRAPIFCSGACRQAFYRFVKAGCKRQRYSKSLKAIAFRNSGPERLPLRNDSGANVYTQTEWMDL